ncbi:MAG: agmatinase [Chloroflexi bacterium]|nr:agmatinase [Chloroflexota bacterium]
MDWSSRFGRAPRYAGLPTFAHVGAAPAPDGLDVAVFGVPYDSATTFRSGARHAPAAIRAVSGILREYHPWWRVAPFETLRVGDLGDVPVVPAYVDDTMRAIQDWMTGVLEAGAFPMAMGGDHSVTLPLLRAVAARHGPLSLIQFDSHPDTWDTEHGRPYGHGTWVRRAVEEGLIDPAASVQVGLRGSVDAAHDLDDARALGLRLIPMDEAAEMGVAAVVSRVRETVRGPVYVTLDIDAADPSCAPGTGTPEVGGFSAREMLQLVRGLRDLPIAGFDIVEVCPAFDCGGITALLAANLMYEMLCLLARQRAA